MEGIPTYYGYSQEAVQEFIDDIRSYFAARDIAAARWIGILSAQIRDPARAQHHAALIAGQPLQVAVAAAAGPGGAVGAAASFECHVQWLKDTFHTHETQQRIQDQLANIKQSSNEAPRDFYTRICHLAQISGLEDGVYPYITGMVFMSGLHQDIADHVRTFGYNTTTEKVALAQNYWLVRNPGMSNASLAQILPRGLHRKLNPTTQMMQPTSATTNLFREPAVVQTNMPRSDPGIDEITRRFAQMEAHIVDLEGKVQKKEGGYRHDNTRGTYTARAEFRRPYRDPSGITCFLCNKTGHMARDCTKRNWQDGRPSTGVNAMTEEGYEYEEEYESEEEIIDIYPADTAPPKRMMARRTQPYPRNKRPQTEPVVEIPVRAKVGPRHKPTNQEWEAAFDDAQRQQIDTKMTDQAEQKRRKVREFDYDPWADLATQKPNITFKQLFQVAPAVKQKVKQGITAERPTIRFAEINAVEDRPTERRTSAYANCSITNYPVNAIVDTGAGSSIITKHVLDRLGWEIEQPARTTLVIADGKRSVPLGEVWEVPITFGNETSTIDMIVTAAETYQIILGNNWLKKVKAIINMGSKTMTFTSRGRKFCVPINTTKGVLPDVVDEETEPQPRRDEVDDEEPYLNLDEIFHTENVDEGLPDTGNEVEDTVSEVSSDAFWGDQEDSVDQPEHQEEPLIREEVLAHQARHMSADEKEDFTALMIRLGECVLCGVELTCPCAEQYLITDTEDFWKDIGEKCEMRRLRQLDQKSEYRSLDHQEKEELMEYNMKTTRCPFCDDRIYCAEQMCTCASTKKIPRDDRLQDHLPKKNIPYHRDTTWGRKEHQHYPDMNQAPYSGRNPHPFANSTGELWDIFWANHKYVGKKHFRNDRDKYQKGYWNNIAAEDLWEVTKRSEFDDQEFNYKYHHTWQEKHDQEQPELYEAEDDET